ncbi:hypothetical protein ACODT3_10660 [Streptomyces sp. 4.24]|uniref:hypothetical protein n=1 Tax=Streptomyces tritrimontium TaxID=3406573 RepID=UPI003BB512B6
MPDLHGWISQQIDQVEHAATEDAPEPWAVVAIRRCAADRKVLARHRADPAKTDSHEATACHGCGTYGDCDWPETDNLNDCPELLDLAAGYGITTAGLAQLDRPQPPRRQEASARPQWDAWLMGTLLRPTTPTSDVPAGLRGPNWKAKP